MDCFVLILSLPLVFLSFVLFSVLHNPRLYVVHVPLYLILLPKLTRLAHSAGLA